MTTLSQVRTNDVVRLVVFENELGRETKNIFQTKGLHKGCILRIISSGGVIIIQDIIEKRTYALSQKYAKHLRVIEMNAKRKITDKK